MAVNLSSGMGVSISQGVLTSGAQTRGEDRPLRRHNSMPVSAAIGERLGRATHRVGVVWVFIGTLSEKKISQKSERWHEQNDRPNHSNDRAPVPPLHPHPGNDQPSNDLEHSQENEPLSCHSVVERSNDPKLKHADGQSVFVPRPKPKDTAAVA